MALTLDQIKAGLKDRRPTAVARATGLTYQTVASIRDGKTLPKYETLVKLTEYLSRKPGK